MATGERIDFSLSVGMDLRGGEGGLECWKSPTGFCVLRAPPSPWSRGGAAAAAGRIRGWVIQAATYSVETVNENMRSLREEKVLECEIKLRWV